MSASTTVAERNIAVGSRVTFRPGPRAKADVTGVVEQIIEPTRTGRGAAVFLAVKCDDGIVRKVRPGACRPA